MSNAKEILPLTGIRGFAALWLVVYHLAPLVRTEFSGEGLLWNFVIFGYLAVDLFAILSGFILAYIYSERLSRGSMNNVRQYLWFRFVRTYPTHLFVLILFVVFALYLEGWASLGASLTNPAFLRQLFLVNGVGFESQWAWNAPTWSLSSEWLCYLLFPLFALVMTRLKSGMAALLFLLITIALTAWIMIEAGFPTFTAVIGWPPPVRIAGSFLVGCLLHRIFVTGVYAKLSSGWTGVFAFVATMSLILFANHIALINRGFFYSFVPVILIGFSILILSLARNEQPVTWLFGNSFVHYFGKISYSIYLIHWLVITRIQIDVWLDIPEGFQALARVLTVVIASILLHHLVEQPSRRGLRKMFSSKD